MSITFQDLYAVQEPAEWMRQFFQGFELTAAKLNWGKFLLP